MWILVVNLTAVGILLNISKKADVNYRLISVYKRSKISHMLEHFNDQDKSLVSKSISQLRKIRSAITLDPSQPITFPVKDYPYAEEIDFQIIPNEQANLQMGVHALIDAVRITEATSNFIIAKLFIETQKTESDSLLDVLAKAEECYGNNSESSTGGASTEQTSFYTLRALCEVYQYGLDYLLDLHQRNNNLTELSADDFINPKVGIYSPLSTDFLYVTNIQKYLQKVYKKSFQLRPVAISSDFRVAILPRDENGMNCFENLDKRAVFIDAKGMGCTEIAIVKAMQDKNIPLNTVIKS